MTDLSAGSLPDLLGKHVTALRRLGVTTVAALAAADRLAVHAGTARLRPRPTLAQVDAWLAAARAAVDADPEPDPAGDDAGTDAGPERGETPTAARPSPDEEGWEALAGFVLSFERHADGRRRLVAEQAERPAPQPRQEWPGWPADLAARWVAGTVTDQTGVEPGPVEPEPVEPGPVEPDGPGAVAPGAVAPPEVPAPADDDSPAAPTRLVLDELVLVDTAGETDLLAAGPDEVAVAPGARLRLHGVPVRPFGAVLMVSRPGRPSVRLGPGRSGPDGRAEITVAGLPSGVHACRVVAYADPDDDRIGPVVVRLPPLALGR